MTNETQTKTEQTRKEAFAGIDIGSRNLKMVAIDSSGNVIHRTVSRYDGDRQSVLTRSLNELEAEVAKRGYTTKKVVSTGSGQELAARAGIPSHITEIKSNIISTKFAYPAAKTIIELGGTDFKGIDVQSGVARMNSKCSSSTGTSLENLASSVGLPLDKFAEEALSSTSPIKTESDCAVFALTRATNALQNGAKRSDVLMGYVNAVVDNCLKLCPSLNPPIIFQGGGAQNKAVVQAFRNKLGLNESDFIVPENPIYRIAYGAALHARENEQINLTSSPIVPEKEDRLPLSIHKKRIRVYNKNKPIAWLGNTVPPEIAIACGYTPSWPGLEAIHAKKNSNGSDPLRIAGQDGYNEDVCSIQRTLLGLAKTNQVESPSLIIGASSYCDFERDVFQHIAKSRGVPGFNLDIPLSGDYTTKVNYLANQLRELHSKVAQTSGKPVDEEAFAKSVDLSLKVMNRMADVNELRARPNAPRVSREMFGFTFNLPTIRGTPQALETVNALHDYFSQNTSNSVDSRPRILWDLLRDSKGETQNHVNSSLVFESVNFTWPKDHPKYGVNAIAQSKDPYDRLSRMILANAAINGEDRLEAMKTLKKRFALDGVLMYQQPHCPLARGYVARNFEKELGIPVYALNNDAMTGSLDPITRTRMDSFLESLQRNPQSQKLKGGNEKWE
jgi:benzoyl-CoA reductase/2-hydroxyglutaryl-CoA dehydratase subunit BcrC/BadD/HgdB